MSIHRRAKRLLSYLVPIQFGQTLRSAQSDAFEEGAPNSNAHFKGAGKLRDKERVVLGGGVYESSSFNANCSHASPSISESLAHNQKQNRKQKREKLLSPSIWISIRQGGGRRGV
jgi:hypothetical protein